jgi:hypothetical protein
MVRVRNIGLGILLVIGLCGYILAFIGHWGVAGHMQVLVAGKMRTVYVGLGKCLKKRGRWPQSLMEAVKYPEAELSERSALDPITERPLSYYPDAKPGTKAILLAQPEARRMGLWPFARMERLGIRVDGIFVDLEADGRELEYFRGHEPPE